LFFNSFYFSFKIFIQRLNRSSDSLAFKQKSLVYSIKMIETSQTESQSENEILTHVDKLVLKRVNALKNIQVKMIDIEAKFYEELHQLECKYRNFYEPLSEQRAKIISGEYEPTGDECKWMYGDEADQEGLDIEDIADSVEAKLNMNDEEEVKGVPLFWLQVFKRTSLISDMIQDHDEKVLAHLKGNYPSPLYADFDF